MGGAQDVTNVLMTPCPLPPLLLFRDRVPTHLLTRPGSRSSGEETRRQALDAALCAEEADAIAAIECQR
jgi:hypothetical protein